MPTQNTDGKSGFGPRPHGIYSYRDKDGSPCIAVTTARKGKKGGGKRLKVLSGQDRNIVYPYLSSILRDPHRAALRLRRRDHAGRVPHCQRKCRHSDAPAHGCGEAGATI